MREEALYLLLEFFVFRSDNESCRTKWRYVVAVSLRDSYSRICNLSPVIGEEAASVTIALPVVYSRSPNLVAWSKFRPRFCQS
jgi:hypothetical protein